MASNAENKDAKPKSAAKARSSRGGARPNSGGARPGSGRKKQDPTEYKPSPRAKLKRQKAAELFSDANAKAAAKTIVEIAQKGGDLTRLRAAREILDRVYGRSPQEIVLVGGGEDKAPIRVDSGVLKNVPLDDLVNAARTLLLAKGDRKPDEVDQGKGE